MDNLEKIADDCKEKEIGIVKINDLDEAKTFGLDDKMPVILYFENKVTPLVEFRIVYNYGTENMKVYIYLSTCPYSLFE